MLQKSGHVERAAVKTSEPLQNALVVRVWGESGSRGWYTLRTMDKCFSGAGLGCLWGGTTTPPQRGPQNREPFLENHCVLFLAKT